MTETEQAIERITTAWDYTPREAQFLQMAALHSGYFLRRQYMRFAHAGSGGAVDRFTRKVLAHGHARLSRSCTKARLFHLCSKGFYGALGEEDNRNRRPREPFTIRQKLMGLDYVLEHGSAQFFPTERSRVGLFADRGIPADIMPARFFAGRNGDRTRRPFVDKQPICLMPQSGDLVHFAYIDEGVLSTAGFETWMAHYAPLFRALRSFVIVYVAGSPTFFGPARRRFDTAFGPRLFATDGPSISQLTAYFQDRRSVEQKDFAALGRVGMDRFRAAHHRLNNAETSVLYQRWLAEGDTVLRDAAPVSLEAEFRTYVLNSDYDLFGTVTGAVAS
jgi:hypothetical protein